MNKKNITVALIILLFSTIFMGCTDTSNEKNTPDNSTYDVSLDQVALVADDLPSSFEKLFENHTTEPTTSFNQTGNGITWNILEIYDSAYYGNVSSGVMQSLIKLDTIDNAQNLIILSRDNLLDFNYTVQSIDSIGDSFILLNKTIIDQEGSYNYFTLMFSMRNIVIALGGSAADQSVFLGYAEIIENRILDEVEDESL